MATGVSVADTFVSGDHFCSSIFENLSDTMEVQVTEDHSPQNSGSCLSGIKECQSEDIIGFYSECEPRSRTRNVYYRYSKPCRGGEPLPVPVTGLPCDQECGLGMFLPLGSVDCQPCAAGTHSVGGGFDHDRWEPGQWPEDMEFKTYIVKHESEDHPATGELVEGDGWSVDKGYLLTTDLLKDAQSAVLEASALLVRDGEVIFFFKVNAEFFFDGLFFLVDGDIAMQKVSQSLDYTEVSIKVPMGYHTFQWVYYKDSSVSENGDFAQINSITIIGTEWAATECDVCTEGTYSPPRSGHCLPCGRDTYADEKGLFECKPCPADQYAHPGFNKGCLPRATCTEDDIIVTYGRCSRGQRQMTSSFREPVICDSARYPLPAPTMVDCAPCNPGMYRPDGTSSCEYCEEGSHAPTTGATSCTPCPYGTAALKSRHYTHFDNWDDLEPDLSTRCQGDCGTNGFVLLGDKLGSGRGHGAMVDVDLDFVVETENFAVIEWEFSVVTAHYMRYQFINVGPGGVRITGFAWDDDGTSRYTQKMTLPGGAHIIRVRVSKIDRSVMDSADDEFYLHRFNITGVMAIDSNGRPAAGASSCTECKGGTFASEGASECGECEAGYYSFDRAPDCIKCQQDKYAPISGMNECLTCAPNTLANDARTDCDYEACTYSPFVGIEYDLSALKAYDMYGPLYDKTGHTYWLNPCTRSHGNRACLDKYFRPIEAHACQDTPLGYSISLGSLQGYYPLEDATLAEVPVRSGLVLTFTNGEPGCSDWWDPTPHPRSTNVTMLCNPSAGIGYPQAIDAVEEEGCQYEFRWDSLYACPLCTLEDYREVLGPCVDGIRKVTYVPLSYPNRCHGGVTAPAPVVQSCTLVTEECPPGQYLPIGEEEKPNPTCAEARPGHYTVGGSVVVDHFVDWATMPIVFDNTSSWILDTDVIRSGRGDTVLVAKVWLVRSGIVSFRYKTIGYGLSAPDDGFQFSIDGEDFLYGIKQTYYMYLSTLYLLTPGEHTLQWRFRGGQLPDSYSRGDYVAISHISISGTAFSARQDTPCPPGSYQDEAGRTFCLPCEENTAAKGGAVGCFPCAPTQYSLPQSADCESRRRCIEEDYVMRYTECILGVRTRYFVLADPAVCFEEIFPFNDSNGTTVLCSVLGCELHPIHGYESCYKCPDGYYHPDEGSSSSQTCLEVPAGNQPVLVKTYFTTGEAIPRRAEVLQRTAPQGRGRPANLPTYEELMAKAEATEPVVSAAMSRGVTNDVIFTERDPLKWPSEFVTMCSGRCGSTGWRLLNDTADSGFHSLSEVDSTLILMTEILQKNGAIGFTYEIQPWIAVDPVDSVPPSEQDLPGLQFFVNGKLLPEEVVHYNLGEGVSDSVRLPLGLGNYTLAWSFHQPSGTREHYRVILSDVVVEGSSNGLARGVQECERGTYNSGMHPNCLPCAPGFEAPRTGMGNCVRCSADTYAESSGTAQCEPCGVGTSASADRMDCDVNSCIFENEVSGTIFDLSSLKRREAVVDEVNDVRFELAICDKLDYTAQCFDENNEEIVTHSCRVDLTNGIGRNIGRLANVFYTDNAGNRGVSLSYTKGEMCNPQQGTYTTTVDFVCNTSLEVNDLRLVNTGTCNTHFEWENIAGCPKCTINDYERKYGECLNGQQTVSLVRAEACNGPAVYNERITTCSYRFELELPFVFAGLAVFCILLFILLVVGIRNKKLSEKYEMLVNESAAEMRSRRATRNTLGLREETPGRASGDAEIHVPVDDVTP